VAAVHSQDSISFEAAWEKAMACAQAVGVERMPLFEAGWRVLAEDVAADRDLPPFDKSAMDGFACRRIDLPGPLRVVEVVPAGTQPCKAIGPRECSRIMTGAPVPVGGDCVFMLEDSENLTDGQVRFVGQRTNDNLFRQGEDVHAGEIVLRQGTLLRAADIAVLATLGCPNPLVYRRPRVGIVATGSELVEPHAPVEGAKIRNSNSYQLHAQVLEAGGLPTYYGIAEDVENVIAGTLNRAAAENDVVLVSGGVSVGDLDLVPAALEAAGFHYVFRGVAMQPGRVALLAHNGRLASWGLPGNPVSTFVVFELLVRPFLLSMAGYKTRPSLVMARLDRAIGREKNSRFITVPVAFTAPGRIAPVEYHGSAHIHALSRADGLLSIPAGTGPLAVDSLVAIHLLRSQ
jgi:molybdopterin molybdotransferase